MTNEIHADDVIGVELVGGDVHIHLISREPVEAGVAAPADERPADGASLAAERPSRPVSRTTGREAWVPAGHLAN